MDSFLDDILIILFYFYRKCNMGIKVILGGNFVFII